MGKEKLNFENNISGAQIEKIMDLQEKLSENLRAEGIPVNNECRLQISGFKNVYPQDDIEIDIKIVLELQKKWSEEGGVKKEGEQFEIIKTIIFNKFLGNDFVAVRSSLYDDFKNGIDNIILDKKTGNLVCAFDEVASISGKEFEDKKDKVLSRNIKQKGVKLKYSIYLKDGEIALGPTEQIPIFYLALPSSRLKEAINRLSPSLEEKTDYERKLFEFFISLIEHQIKTLRLYPQVEEILSKSINSFEDRLKKLYK